MTKGFINNTNYYLTETAMGVDIHAQEVVTKYTSTVHLSVFKILILLSYCPTPFSNMSLNNYFPYFCLLIMKKIC